MDEKSAQTAVEDLCVDLILPVENIISDLQKYAEELVRWQKVKNLVSRETLSEIWSRHFLDSMQLAKHIDPDRGIVLDYGSGGGLPAIVLAIAFKHVGIQVHMIEANTRKCSFLRHISRTLGLNCTVHDVRAESFDLPKNVSVGTITARGFTDLSSMFEICTPHFGTVSLALLQKGRGYDEEIAASKPNWSYALETFSSVVEPDSVILAVSGLKRR